ncbi:MAG: tyrosine--tRNA ligase [Chloroflexi bacterium]|nr:tyrosine--tRNA ligase [Chloroflexota bacterium]MBU1747744.1 tyrosine--tRNA ligase [Chloroflexota bacterium]MBU1878195.1 tyrosine--tRNA ligase [Chloroflexota bacterium]
MKPDIDTLLRRGVAEVIVEDELRQKLTAGRKLRLKEGFDPSKPHLHVGHAATLRKLRQFQDLGHQVVLIVGDWTAQIGDPSGRDESRTVLGREEVLENAETYMQQFFHIVDRDRAEVRWQSEWFDGFNLADVFKLTSHFTYAQMMAHETFRTRVEQNRPLTLMELMYPLLQAYDSVAVEADVEFGGMDQKFNILAGREMQPIFGQPPQNVFLVPLLPGTDGRKMSKSFGNTIDLEDPAHEMYGKTMSLADAVLMDYLACLTDIPDLELAEMEQAMRDGTMNPRDAKMRLGRELVTQFHGPAAAQEAEAEFVRVFQQRDLPSDMPEFALDVPMNVVELMVEAGLVPSKSEARRLVVQGGVRLDDERIESADFDVPARDGVLRVGKRRFLRLIAQ